MTDEQKILNILKRRKYFDLHFSPIEDCDRRQDISYKLSNTCPICGYMTLESRCNHDICSFCFWQDDGQDNPEADKDYIGPNWAYSITAFRIEIYDWMTKFKENKTTDNLVENSLGHELIKLDSFINENKSTTQLILNQIEVLSKLFSTFRNIESDKKPN